MNKKILILVGLLIAVLLVAFFPISGLQGKLKRDQVSQNSRDFTSSREKGRVFFKTRDAGKNQLFIARTNPDLDKIIDRSTAKNFSTLRSEINQAVKQKPEADQDLDGDGLSLSDEEKYGSDPAKPDTDSDDLFDGYEVKNSLNPLNPDSDSDGINDGDELKFGTNPNNSGSVYKKPDLNLDSDVDELTDFFEIKHNIAPYLDFKVPESMVLASGEAKKSSRKVEIDGKTYDADYEFSNCSKDNSLLIVNFPKNSTGVNMIECTPKNNKFVCEQLPVGALAEFGEINESLGVDTVVVYLVDMGSGWNPNYCSGKEIIYK